MIFLVQSGSISTCKFFKHPKLHEPVILFVFEKFTRAYLFQIALEIVWLPIQIIENNTKHSWDNV